MRRFGREQAFLYWIAPLVAAGVLTSVLVLARPGGSGKGNPAPTITARQTTVDLGLVSEDLRKDVTFVIANEGGAALELTRIRATCPCLEPRLDRAFLRPGESAKLSVKVVPPSRAGRWTDRILVYSNDPDRKVLPLEVTAFVRLRCKVSPSELALDRLPEAGSREVELTITGPSGERAFKVLGISAETEAIQLAQLEPAGLIEGLDRAVWKARLLIRGRGEPLWKDRVTIRTTDEKIPTIEVPVTVREASRFRAEPPVLTLRASQGRATCGDVAIFCKDGIPLQVAHIETPDWLVAECRASQGRGARLRVTLAGNNTTKMMQGEIIVTLKQDSKRVRIPVLVFSATGGR